MLGDDGPIVLQATDRDIVITKDGTIKVREGISLNSDSHARQAAARDVRRSAAAAEGRRHRPSRRRTACTPTAAADANAHVVQGAIEKSNVRPVIEMTRMIEITRAYTEVATMLQQQSDMRKNSIQQARRSSGLSEET